MDEHLSGALQPLQDEPFPAKKACAKPLGELDVDVDLPGGAEERVALAEDRAVLQRHADDFPRVGSGKRDRRRGRLAPEKGEEETLARENLALEAAEDAALHPRVHLDAVSHVGHRARLGAYFVTGAHA